MKTSYSATLALTIAALGLSMAHAGETEIAAKAQDGVARIAFVGDSITLGWGVAEQETFSHKVVADLSRRGRKVDGFNLGVGQGGLVAVQTQTNCQAFLAHRQATSGFSLGAIDIEQHRVAQQTLGRCAVDGVH